jgi:capsular polysaccharide biosynthesis protein
MSLQSSVGNEVLVLRPESTSRRHLPVNFKPEDMNLFANELERVIPETRLLELRNVSASPEGILFRRGKMLPESFAFAHTRAGWKRRSVAKFLFSNYFLRRHRKVDTDMVWVVDDWSAGYFHWLGDVLPRLFSIKDRLKDLVLLLPHGYRNLEFVRASLTPFMARGVEFIEPHEVVVCKKLIVPTHTAPSGHYNDEIIREIRKLLVEFYVREEAGASDERVYISRARAPKRKIFNEEEVVAVLREFDFRVVHPEEHSFAEQVRMAAGARYLVSNHGAGLTNMLFMDPGANVFEVRQEHDDINNCYFTLASALNLNYYYQSCPPRNRGEDPHTSSLEVDTKIFRANLESMLKS